jgi:hypothetical protein
MAHNFNSLAGKCAAKHQHAGLGAESAHGYGLLDAGNGQPPSPGTHRGRSAQFRGMAIGIGLDHGHQLSIWRSQGL